MPLSASARSIVRDALTAAPAGKRTETADRLAETFGVSRATVYRAAERRGTKRARAWTRPEYRDWTRSAVRIAQEGPPGEPVPLDEAIRGGIDDGVLPPEAADMPVQTAYRVARELGLKPKRRRTQRLDADWPMQALQCDGSTSKYLVPVKRLPDGDWLLKLHRKPTPARGYKNKPLGPDRERVIVYGLWDMCTGYTLSRYVVARGETAADELTVLCWALEESDDPRIPFHGKPDDLWFDQGNVFKSAAARDFIERLDINPNPGRPYNKERMGGVERAHRARWARFERTLFLRREKTIALSELNARLLEFHVRENARRPSRTPVAGRRVSRTAAWVALTNARPADNRLQKIVPNAIKTIAHEKTDASIDNNGHVRWDNVTYEVDDWHSMHVTARRGLVGEQDHIIVEDPKTKERRVAYPYRKRPYGAIRGIAKTELEQLAEAPLEFEGADLYAPGRDTADPKVTAIPARSADAAPLEDPLEAGSHPDIERAMSAFTRLYPHPLRPEHRALVVERIRDAGLAKQAVVDIAQGLTALAQEGRDEDSRQKAFRAGGRPVGRPGASDRGRDACRRDGGGGGRGPGVRLGPGTVRRRQDPCGPRRASRARTGEGRRAAPPHPGTAAHGRHRDGDRARSLRRDAPAKRGGPFAPGAADSRSRESRASHRAGARRQPRAAPLDTQGLEAAPGTRLAQPLAAPRDCARRSARPHRDAARGGASLRPHDARGALAGGGRLRPRPGRLQRGVHRLRVHAAHRARARPQLARPPGARRRVPGRSAGRGGERVEAAHVATVLDGPQPQVSAPTVASDAAIGAFLAGGAQRRATA